jgi:hypothetical protein
VDTLGPEKDLFFAAEGLAIRLLLLFIVVEVFLSKPSIQGFGVFSSDGRSDSHSAPQKS